MIIGTPHFATFGAAYLYYSQYEPAATIEEMHRVVGGKIDRGDIHIGKPNPEKYPGFVSMHVNSEGRYEVTVK